MLKFLNNFGDLLYVHFAQAFVHMRQVSECFQHEYSFCFNGIEEASAAFRFSGRTSKSGSASQLLDRRAAASAR